MVFVKTKTTCPFHGGAGLGCPDSFHITPSVFTQLILFPDTESATGKVSSVIAA